ncbi:FMN-binding protein [Leuconostoc lactis]|uniref:FMN-binding protein n=1 Tax=Leuconostoc lactis TaxID=1246 RepID=UPI0021C07015|nr:FMN-binding protein [Leuconostoc lactis]MCT8387958.1 FMN-binding protein [Leuconostoc lactis]
MKKIITLSITTIALLAMILDVFFLFFYTPAKTTTSATSTTPAPARNVAATTTTYKDGTYLGTDASYEYGTIQVQITVANGKITQVKTVKYPTDSHRTAAINAQALPVYEKSAVSAQSAHFSNISGATETWHGFQASLKQAISQAG